MANYVKTEKGKAVAYPYSIGQLRRDNQNTSFPKSIPDETLAAYGIYPVADLEAPSIDAATQKLVQDASPSLVDGQWQIGWSVVNLTAEEIAALEAARVPTKAQQEALRQAAYASESDPIFFMAQRGEATVEEWTAKVAEIKARYPYPTEEV